MHTPIMLFLEVTLLSDRHTKKLDRNNTGGRQCLVTSATGAKCAKHAKEGKHPTAVRNYQRVTYLCSNRLSEYRLILWSTNNTGVYCKYVLSMMDHLTRFAVLTPIPNKSAETVANVLIEKIISIFGPPEMLHTLIKAPNLRTRSFTSCKLYLDTRKPVRRRTVHRVIQCQNECIQPCMQCSRCTVPWIATTGRSSYQWYS